MEQTTNNLKSFLSPQIFKRNIKQLLLTQIKQIVKIIKLLFSQSVYVIKNCICYIEFFEASFRCYYYC